MAGPNITGPKAVVVILLAIWAAIIMLAADTSIWFDLIIVIAWAFLAFVIIFWD